MIGQKSLRAWIDSNSKNIPSLIIIVGEKGCGKRTLAKYIARSCKSIYSESDIKVEAVREVIHTAYSVSSPVVYCFPDCDTMRNEAKNALLKITEEPPKSAKFIMTVCDDSKILDTLKSRGVVLRLEPYSKSDIKAYANKYDDSELRKLAISASINPRTFDCIMQYGTEFIDYVQLVVDNICEVQPANAFKSSSKLALKIDSDGYDLQVFFTMVQNILEKKIWENVGNLSSEQCFNYATAVCLTSRYIDESNKLGINKQQLYDDWVFEIRKLDI